LVVTCNYGSKKGTKMLLSQPPPGDESPGYETAPDESRLLSPLQGAPFLVRAFMPGADQQQPPPPSPRARGGRGRVGAGAGSSAWRTSGAKTGEELPLFGQDRSRGIFPSSARGPAAVASRSTGRGGPSGCGRRVTYPLRSRASTTPARRALVQIEEGREGSFRVIPPRRTSASRAVALGHRDVVAADPVAVAELVDPHQLREGVVELRCVLLQGRCQPWRAVSVVMGRVVGLLTDSG